MNVLDLFSGIGGFSLGLQRAGMQTVAFCEVEKFPQKVLNKHWPKVPIYDDIRTLTAERLQADDIGPIDLVCGGFPCQPFSAAGKRRGTEDDRDLWPEMFRVIHEVRPRWVIGENVAGFVKMGLPRTLSDLEGAGYETQTFNIPACAVGAPHERKRIWIVAHAQGKRRGETGSGVGRSASRPAGCGDESQNVADSESRGQGKTRNSYRQKGREGSVFAQSIRGCDVPDSQSKGLEGDVCKKLADPGEGGFDANLTGSNWWAVEPDVGRVAHGVPARVDRLKGLGNAVVPQVVEIIGRAIMETENQSA